MKKINSKYDLHKTYADTCMQELIDRVCAKYSYGGKMYLPFNVVRSAVRIEIEQVKQLN